MPIKQNKQQKKAITHGRHPLMVVAGPGSGKTFVITERICHILDELGADPSRVLVVTFSRAAARQMQERFTAKYRQRHPSGAPADYKRVTFATFHSFFYHILLMAYGENARSYIFSAADDSGKPDSTSDCSRRSAHGTADDAEENIRFDEMISLTQELLSQREDIRQALKNRYQWILIDEFQDIDPEQYRIIQLITDRHSNLTIVGDDDQSIYAFRGSDPSIMLGFQRDYPGARKVVLNINYRSVKEIVAYSQRLIRHNRKRIQKRLRSASPDSGVVRTVPCLNITDEIEKLYAAIDLCLRRNVPMSDMAVLYRTNFQTRPLLLLFNEHGIDVTDLNMMTFHTSKGLEWPIVFILDVNDGITPHRRSEGEDASEEERRAFYVAMTRAKRELYLFYCLRRYEKKAVPSPYLQEMKSLPQRMLDRIGALLPMC